MGTILGNNTTIGGGGGSSLPPVTASDNGDVLTVVNGSWDKAAPSGGSASLNTTLLSERTITIDPDSDVVIQLDEESRTWMHWVIVVNDTALRASNFSYYGNINVGGETVTVEVMPERALSSGFDFVNVYFYSESELPTFDITISIELELETVATKQTISTGDNVALCIPVAGDDMYYMNMWDCRVGNVPLYYDGGQTLYSYDDETGYEFRLEATEETYISHYGSDDTVYALQLSISDGNGDPVAGEYEVEILHPINPTSNPGVLFVNLVDDWNGHLALDRCYEEITEFYSLGYSVFAFWIPNDIYTGVISHMIQPEREGSPWATAYVAFGAETVEYKTSNVTYGTDAFYMPLVGDYPGGGSFETISILHDADAGVYTMSCTLQEFNNYLPDIRSIPPIVYYGETDGWTCSVLGVNVTTNDNWESSTTTIVTTMGDFTASLADDYPTMQENNNNNF